jgi:STE24 endopeptidase
MNVDKAKKYSALKYTLSIIDTVYLLALLFLFQGSGASKFLAQGISGRVSNQYLIIPAYLLIAYVGYLLLDFPLNFYRSFTIEHKFSLSTQKISDWVKDQLKVAAISYIVSFLLLETFYAILKTNPYAWWLVVSLFWIFFSLIFARLMPIIIIPLFFKYKKLADDSLRQRIINLADKMKVRILDVFEIDFSKKTLKANAAFVGWGKTRRVLLADTLNNKYTHDEIEAILAHEFAHYRMKHLLKLILVNSLVILLSFYAVFKTSGYALNIFGLSSLSDIAALPVILIYFSLIGITFAPLEAYISRRMERNADMMSLKITGLKGAFISMMEKLSAQNLADRSPHPVIKFFFFDHPPIDERIKMAEDFMPLNNQG